MAKPKSAGWVRCVMRVGLWLGCWWDEVGMRWDRLSTWSSRMPKDGEVCGCILYRVHVDLCSLSDGWVWVRVP